MANTDFTLGLHANTPPFGAGNSSDNPANLKLKKDFKLSQVQLELSSQGGWDGRAM
jgi:hypothetical protein